MLFSVDGSKLFCAMTYRAVCFYRSSNLTSSKLFYEYTLSGIIVQAKNYFTTDALIIDKIEFRDPISNGLIHTEEINGPGKIVDQLTVEQWFEKRKEQRSFLARYSHPFTQQPA